MLTRFTLKNFQLTVAVFIMAALLGINSFNNMPRSEDPPLTSAYFYIVAVYPGASPKDLEQLVVEPVEESLNELEDIKKLTSSMNDGLAVINIEFDADVDGDRKYDEVNRQINNIRNKLPSDLYSLEVGRWATTNVNILQYALVTDNASYRKLNDVAEDLKKEIEKTSSIKKVEISAYPEQEIRISFDLQKMAQRHISVNNVMQAIQSNNVNIPGGNIDVGNNKFNIKTTGNYKALPDIQTTVVHAGNGKVIYLKDIASVEFDYPDQAYIGRYNGKRALFITANQKAGTNIFHVVKSVNKNVSAFESKVPSDMKLIKAFDQSVNVDSRLTRLYKDFGIAILLILITLLPLGTRASIIVMIAIPSSLLIGLILLYFTGFSLNQLSIVGLVISLGLLVDDSIVVVENIVRFMRNGYSRMEATIKATSQISWAVIGCTATMVIAFVPLMVLPGGPGNFMRSLPAAVVLTLLASLLVSFTLTPLIASRFLKEKEFEKENYFLRLLNKINDGPYQKLLMLGLKYPKITMLISGVAIAGSLMLLPVVGFSLFPKAEKPQFFINVETAPGSNISRTDSVARYIESVLAEKKEVLNYCTNVGKGNPMVYYNIMQANEKPNLAQFFVQLKEYDQKTTPLFLKKLGEELDSLPGTRIQIKEFQQGTAEEAPIEIAFFGSNLDTLKRLASFGEQILKSTNGTTFVRNPLKSSVSDLLIRINKDKAGMLGVPVVEVEKTVRMAIAGLVVGDFTDEDGEDYKLLCTLNGNKKKAIEDLDKIYVSSVTGAQIPLNHLASVEFQHSLNLIEHHQRERSITVRANVLPGYLTDNVTKDVLAKLDKVKLPEGYRYEPFGEIASRQETFGNMNTAIIVTFFVILLILILEFKTVKGSLIVASSIPLGIIGSILLLFITGYSFSFTAFVGMISLIGIEVKNSIILVDYTNQLREKGTGLDEAIQTAGKIRFIPIILTTLTAIGGLLPLAIQGSEMFSPLALTIIGGLISSTIFTRVVTPVLYKLLMKNSGSAITTS
jgi:multidrug efflux pump subunit AcrB